MTRPPFTDHDSLMTWLAALPEPDRVRTARLLGNTQTTRDLAAAADATVYEMTRQATASAVAAQLGLTVKQVRRAVENHSARQRARAVADTVPI